MLLALGLSVLISCALAFNDTVSLIDLDKRLTDLLLYPKKGQGSLLLSDGYFLYTNLDDVSDMIEAKDPKGTITYNEIEKAGGIKFFKAAYDPDKVRETFQYNRDDYEMLIATIGGIENTWKSIQVTMLKCFKNSELLVVGGFIVLSSHVLYTTHSACHYTNLTLPEIDSQITEMLTNLKSGEGDSVMNASQFFYNQIEDINMQCIREDPRKVVLTWMQSSLVKGIDKVKDLVSFGEPKFIKLNLTRRDIRDAYGWSDAEYIRFETYTLGIKIIWHKFLEYIQEDENKY